MNRRIKLFFSRPIVQHVFFWVLYFAFNVIRWGFFFDDFRYSFESNLVEFAVHLVVVYFNLYYLIPKYLAQRKIGKYTIYILLSITILSLLRILLTYHLVTTDVWKEANLPNIGLFNPNYIIAVIVGEIYVVAFTSSIKLGIDWAKNLHENEELENKKLETELAFLRSQIQPHFFFNTLNNLYYLILSKSDKAPEMVLKLSDLMSYVVYKGKQKSVTLMDEIKHIQDYIDLERLRYGDRLNLEFNLSGNVEDRSLPPLLLLPFVENAFKHGQRSQDQVLNITIDLSVEKGRLIFKVQNPRVEIPPTSSKRLSEQTGIGIQNTKRRLNLLFKKAYSLDINKTKNQYSIKLELPLYDQMSDS